MFRKWFYLAPFAFVLVLGLVSNGHAAVINWTGAGPDHLWSTPTNWAGNAVPTSADRADINVSPGPIVTTPDAVAGDGMRIGASRVTVDGGTLDITGEIRLATEAGSVGTINVAGGSTLNTSIGLKASYGGDAVINITGGTLYSARHFYGNTTNFIVNLDAGLLDTDRFCNNTSGDLTDAPSLVDIGFGKLRVRSTGHWDNQVKAAIAADRIVAFGGIGTLVVDDVNQTITAVHPLQFNPSYGATVSPGAVELSWTLPDPCVPGQPVLVDVYFTDDFDLLNEFTDPAAIKVVSKQNVTSVVVQAQNKKQYYWAVDTYIGSPNDPIWGPIVSFTADNIPPKVDAGDDVVTYLVNGVRTGLLEGVVIDDGAVAPCTVVWTVVSAPNDIDGVPAATIADPSAEQTEIVLTAEGTYVLQIEANDGEYSGSDTVTIKVYNDSCEAAQSLPDFVPLAGDLNGDCRVDDVDMALLQENWLKDVSLAEEWFKVD